MKNPSRKTSARKPWTRPVLRSRKLFETDTLACNKLDFDFACRVGRNKPKVS
ncbi:MAG: hypothetical protein V1809_13960 [Planctomycetota bacterium]